MKDSDSKIILIVVALLTFISLAACIASDFLGKPVSENVKMILSAGSGSLFTAWRMIYSQEHAEKEGESP